MSNPNIQYRPDIDGIRALAVLGVVIYHAFPSLLPGGFVGVDVFFVISGFLIGTILFRSTANNTFSFADFYSRRIRRIFPALFVVLIFCISAGRLVLLPDELQQLGKQVASGAAFVANFVFWSESGYFDTAAELKPLLHLWSLAIEEQFYLIWPLLLWSACKLRFNLLAVTALIAATSFALNILQIDISPVATFFLLPSRAWELLSGSVLAWVALQNAWTVERSRLLSLLENISSMLGFAMIAWAMLFVRSSDAFPGWYAVIPVMGTILLIAAGPKSHLNKYLLSNRIAILVGLISFPLYLWHWPLLSFARIVESEIPTSQIRMAAVAIAVVLAWGTYKFIELPLRFGNSKRTQTFALASVMAAIGISGYYGYTNGESAEQAQISSMLLDSKSICDSQFPQWSKTTDNPCRMQKKSANSIAIVGDSHAGHLFVGISGELNKDEGLAVFAASCAAPFIDVATAQKNIKAREVRKDAYKLINSAYDYILKDKSITTVVLAHHPLCSINDTIDMDNQGISDYKQALENGMRRTISKLVAADKKVVIVLDNPPLPYDPKLCQSRPFRLTQKPDQCSFPRNKFDSITAFSGYRSIVERVIKDFPQVKSIDLSKPLCDEERCYLSKNGRTLYLDHSHLNRDGSRFVAPYIMAAIRSVD